MSEEMSKDEQIGFHKGSLSTLSKERTELARLLGIVEQLMQMHAKALADLGIKLEQGSEQPNKDQKPIEDLV